MVHLPNRDFVGPILHLLQTEFGNESLEIMDDLLRMLDPYCTEPSLRTSLLGQKAILKITRDSPALALSSEPSWNWEESAMSTARGRLAIVVSTYMASINHALITGQARFGHESFQSTRDSVPFPSEEEGFENYEDLLTTLQDLDDFFTEDIVAGHSFMADSLVRPMSVDRSSQVSLASETSLPIDDLLDEGDQSRVRTMERAQSFSTQYSMEDETDVDFSIKDDQPALITPTKLVLPKTTKSRVYVPRVARLLSFPSAKIYFTVPILVDADIPGMTNGFSGLSGLKVLFVTEKSSESFLWFLFASDKTSAQHSMNAVEHCADLVNNKASLIVEDSRFQKIDFTRKCHISIGVFHEHYKNRSILTFFRSSRYFYSLHT